MIKNTAGQTIGAQLIDASDGSAFTGAVTCYVTGDGGTQAVGSVGSGACTHEGNGYHTYQPAQAETNYNVIAFTFVGAGAIPVTVQVFTVGYDPTAAQLPANVVQISGDSTAADNLEAACDGTGYNLGGGDVVAASVTGAVGSVTGNVGGNVTGSVGSISGVTFPTNFGDLSISATTGLVTTTHSFPDNFASLGITADGHIENVVLVATTTTNTDMRGTDNALLAASYTAPDNDGIAAIEVIAEKLDDTLEDNGGTYRFTEAALAEGPGGGSGATAQEVWEYATRTLTAGTKDSEIDAIKTRVELALPNAAPDTDSGLPIVSGLLDADDLESSSDIATAVDTALQTSFADVITWSERGLTMIQDGGGGVYEFTAAAVSEIDVGEVEVDLSEIESIQSQILSAVQSGINVAIVESADIQTQVRADSDITLALNEGRTVTILHDGLDLTGETLRFTVYRRMDDNKMSPIFELEGTNVTGGDGSTTVKFSATETAKTLGEQHYWDLWQNPDNAASATRWGTGGFRVLISCNNV